MDTVHPLGYQTNAVAIRPDPSPLCEGAWAAGLLDLAKLRHHGTYPDLLVSPETRLIAQTWGEW